MVWSQILQNVDSMIGTKLHCSCNESHNGTMAGQRISVVRKTFDGARGHTFSAMGLVKLRVQ